MLQKSNRLFKFIIFIADIALILLSYYLAFRFLDILGKYSQSNYESFIKALPYICITAGILLYVYGTYSILNKHWIDIFITFVIVEIFLTIMAMAITFFVRGFAFPRSIFISSAIMQFTFLLFWRTFLWKMGRMLHGRQPVIVIGEGEQLEETTKKILLVSGDLYCIKYLFDLKKDFKLAHKLIKDVSNVFLCSGISETDKSKIFSYCIAEGKNMFIIPELFEISIKNSSLDQFDDIPVFKIDNLSLSVEQKVIKRIFDLIISTVGLIISFPLMIIISLAIKITSPGRVLLRQERVIEGLI